MLDNKSSEETRNNMKLPIQSSPISRAVGTAFGGVTSGIQPSSRRMRTKWDCYAGNSFKGEVEIWGHNLSDALWACNEWHKEECQGGCDKAKLHILWY